MHDFKMIDYTKYFISNDTGLNVMITIIAPICVAALIAYAVYEHFDLTDIYVSAFQATLIGFLIAIPISLIFTSIAHFTLGQDKYDIQYEAKVKVVEYKSDKNKIIDEYDSNELKYYIVGQLGDKKQRIYINQPNEYIVNIDNEVHKGDTVKIILHFENDRNIKFKPQFGELNYIDALKNSESNKNYIEIKK